MNYARLSVLVAALAIAGCDGNATFVSAPAATSDSFKIDSGNGVLTAQVSYEAALDSSSLVSIGSPVGLSVAAPNGSSIATQVGDPTGLALDIVSLVPFGPDVYPCGVGLGTVTMSGDIETAGTLTPGDTIRIEYDMCDEGLGEVIDGVIDLTVVDFSGELLLQTYMVAMDAVVTDLQVMTPADTVTGNGDATILLDTEQTPFVEASVSGTRLTMDANESSETLSTYASSTSFDGGQVPAEYTFGASGTLDSTQLAGIVTYATGPEFVGSDLNFPHSGELTVQGDESFVTLVAVDDQNVRIEIDDNGDGTVDETINMTWVEFLGLQT